MMAKTNLKSNTSQVSAGGSVEINSEVSTNSRAYLPRAAKEPALEPIAEMSSRRITRAGSKGPSEISNAASTARTPRRATRSAALPTIGTRTSNAYGTNTVVAPSRVGGPEVANQISGVLDGLLNPVSNATLTKKGRGSQVSTNRGRRSESLDALEASRSFFNESGIFGEAHIESSVQPSPDLSRIREEDEDEDEIEDEDDEDQVEDTPSPIQTFQAKSREAQRQALEEVARAERVPRVQVLPPPVSRLEAVKEQVLYSLHKVSRTFKHTNLDQNFLVKSAILTLGLLPLFLALLIAIPGTGFHYYGLSSTGVKHTVGQFVPFRGSFSTGDLGDLRSRVWKAEQDILKLQQRPILDNASIKKLQTILPEAIVVKKDKNGIPVLPNGLWRAIHDKIQADPTLIISGASASDGAVISAKQVDAAVATSAEKYFKSNEIKTKVIDGRFSHLLRNAHDDEVVISRSEAIDLIRDNWEDNQAGIKSEISKIQKELGQIIRTVSKLEDGPLSKVEIEAIAKDVFAKLLPNAQLGALSKTKLRSNINYGHTKVNHFSLGTGAVINARKVSPNFVFPDMNMWSITRKFRDWFLDPVPLPKPASEALTKWEEHGDCWCSPAKDDTGFGVSLAVITGSNIYPEEVVIEHIHSTAALEPGATPKYMELLAYIPELDRFEAAKVISEELFPELQSDETILPYRYVKVASWTYDSNTDENIQAFDVQLDMKRMDLHTNRLIVRAKNNWGDVEYTCLYRVRVHGEIVHTPGIY